MSDHHARTILLGAVQRGLEKSGILVLDSMEAVKPTDLPCAIVEESQEQVTKLDDTLRRRATTLERRIRFGILVMGKTKEDRDDVSLVVEKTVVASVTGAGFGRADIVGVGFAQARVGAEGRAFVASTFYEVVYSSPTYRP